MQNILQKIQSIRNMPDKIMLVGFFVAATLIIKAMIVSAAQFSYENFILCEFLYQNSVFVFIECTIAAFLFSYLEKMKKDEESTDQTGRGK